MVDVIILYGKDETEFTSNGLGTLSDTISCVVAEELNGEFELSMEYPVNGVNYASIQTGRILKVRNRPNGTPQLFRIYAISKTLSGTIEIEAQHISYDMSAISIKPGIDADNLQDVTEAGVTKQGAFSQIKANMYPEYSSASGSSNKFNLRLGDDWGNTDDTKGNVKIEVPMPLRGIMGNSQGCLLNVYEGYWTFNNFTATYSKERGTDRGVTIRYAYNMTSLSNKDSMQMPFTYLHPYYATSNNSEVSLVELGDTDMDKLIRIGSGSPALTKILTVDLTSEVDEAMAADNEAASIASLAVSKYFVLETSSAATESKWYKLVTSVTPSQWPDGYYKSIRYPYAGDTTTLFAPVGYTEGSVYHLTRSETHSGETYNAGYYRRTPNDWVYICNELHPLRTVDATNKSFYDYSYTTASPSGTNSIVTYLRSCAQKYIVENNLGTDTTEITTEFVNGEVVLDDKHIEVGDIVTIEYTALGINSTVKVTKITYDPIIGRYKSIEVGDPSKKDGIANTISAIGGESRTKVSNDQLKRALDQSEKKISGTTGGYIAMNNSLGGDIPDQLLVMDGASISESKYMWKWNYMGLMAGAKNSSTGDWTYGLAITIDGKIVADYIKAGTLSGINIDISGTDGSGKSHSFSVNGSTGLANFTNCEIVSQVWNAQAGRYDTTFAIDSSGNATISGTVTATAGSIGGATIQNGVLKIADANLENVTASAINAKGITAKRVAVGTIFDANTLDNNSYLKIEVKDSTQEHVIFKIDTTASNPILQVAAANITGGFTVTDPNDPTKVIFSVNPQANLVTINGVAIDSGSITRAKVSDDLVKSTNFVDSATAFSQAGTYLNLADGLIKSKNFAIDSSGNCYVNGTINATAGNIGPCSITVDATNNIERMTFYDQNYLIFGVGDLPGLVPGTTFQNVAYLGGFYAYKNSGGTAELTTYPTYVSLDNTAYAGDYIGLDGMFLGKYDSNAKLHAIRLRSELSRVESEKIFNYKVTGTQTINYAKFAYIDTTASITDTKSPPNSFIAFFGQSATGKREGEVCDISNFSPAANYKTALLSNGASVLKCANAAGSFHSGRRTTINDQMVSMTKSGLCIGGVRVASESSSFGFCLKVVTTVSGNTATVELRAYRAKHTVLAWTWPSMTTASYYTVLASYTYTIGSEPTYANSEPDGIVSLFDSY